MRTQGLMAGLIILYVITAFGCSTPNTTVVHETKNPDAEEVLTVYPDADIFQFAGVIYMTGIDWVEELTLTKGEQVGEITAQNDNDTKFEDGMSNKLPIGAMIFSTKENEGPILLIESKGKIMKYYAIVEG